MAWVRSEYAGELAVLMTWLVALLPWSVSTLSLRIAGEPVRVVAIRFLYFRLQYVFGLSFGDQERVLLWAFEAPGFNPPALATASWTWVLAAAAFSVPLVISVAYYLRESHVTAASPVDPVRLQGALLAVAGLALTLAALLFVQGQPQTVPVGGPFALLFGYLLLTAERT